LQQAKRFAFMPLSYTAARLFQMERADLELAWNFLTNSCMPIAGLAAYGIAGSAITATARTNARPAGQMIELSLSSKEANFI